MSFKYFNTFRPYTPEGQRIFCLVEGGKVWFIDQARDIRGVMKSGSLKNEIMTEYDAGHYDDLGRSDEQIQKIDNHYGVGL